MSEQGYPHGVFCWTDLATTDVAAAKDFYAALFGWSFEDTSVEPDGVYTELSVEGGRIGGLFAQSAEMKAAGTMPGWTAYVSVDNLDGLVGRIPSLGGTLVIPPFDIPDTGRMATIADPQRATINLWSRESRYSGADRLGPLPGTACWYELAASDLDEAATFYSALFGWAVKETQTPEHVYVEFMLEGEPVGGMLPVSVTGPDVRPHWLVYFAVDDCDAAVATATRQGGRVCKAPFEVAEVGRVAVLADPQGAAFAVIALSTPA